MNKFTYPRNRLQLFDKLRERVPDQEIGRLDINKPIHRTFMVCAVNLLARFGKRKERNGFVIYGFRLKAKPPAGVSDCGDLYVYLRHTKGVARSACLNVFEHNHRTRTVRRVFSFLYFCRTTQKMTILSGDWQNRLVDGVSQGIGQRQRERDKTFFGVHCCLRLHQ